MARMRLGLTTLQAIELYLELRRRFNHRLSVYFDRPIGQRGSLVAYIREHRPDLYPEVLALAAKIKLTGELK